MKARLTIRVLKVSTAGWSPSQIADIEFAERVTDMDGVEGPLLAVYKRGTIFEGAIAEQLIAEGKADEVTE